MSQNTSEVPTKLQRSSRDPAAVPRLLETWLGGLLPAGAQPHVVVHSGVDANGMSSETIMLDVTWRDGGAERVGRYVARVEPTAADVPVFPRYDLQAQYEVIRAVGELTDLPVPELGFAEPTGEVLGTPFFLMHRVDGVIPPDVLPYPFGDNWLFDADRAQQEALQRDTVSLLARLHALPEPTSTFAYLDPARHGHQGATPLQRHLARTRAWYEFAAADIGSSPLAERCLAWLESHLPSPDPDDTVVLWGDARIGNVIYRDFAPVAVLDWEMASLGPVSSTCRGWSSPTRSSSRSPARSSCRACRTSCASPTSSPSTSG